jgi:uncharacterized protein YrrD
MQQNILVKATKVLGTSVLAGNGNEFATVKDIMYDPKLHKIAYLVTDEGGFFSEAKVIPFGSISALGPDRIMVPDENVEIKVSMLKHKLNTLIRDDKIIGHLNVVTETGEKLGKIADFHFDPTNGRVVEFEVSQGLLNRVTNGTKTMRVKKINVIGHHAVIVVPEVSESFEVQAEQQGLQALVKDTKVALGEVVDNSKHLAEKAKEVISEKSNQATIAAREYTEIASEKTQHIAKQIEHKAQPTIQNIQTNIDQNTPSTKEEWQQVAEQKAQQTGAAVKDGFQTLSHKAKQLVEDAQQKAQQKRINNALGHRLNKDLIDIKTNTIIAKRGDLIDAALIQKVKRNNGLQLLDNAYV